MNIWLSVTAAASATALVVGLCGALNAEVVVRGIEGRPLDEVRPAPEFFKPDPEMISAQPSPSESRHCRREYCRDHKIRTASNSSTRHTSRTLMA